MIFPSQFMPSSGDFVIEHLNDSKLLDYYGKLGFARLDEEREAFVYSHVKPKYDKDCIFMYQAICRTC